MYSRKESNKNCYYPSFLCMELDTPDNLEYILDYPMDERTEAVFLHEYIHYMQDLMTITGLARIETIVDQIKWAVDKISNCKNLRLPLILETNFYSLKANATSLLICKGDFKIKDASNNDITPSIHEIISFKLEEKLIDYLNGEKARGMVVAVLSFKDDKHMEYKYRVGELAISESMAYIIENMIYKDVLPKGSDCPYEVVKKIVTWKLKQEVEDLVLIALCDVCLMYSFPGMVLYYLMEFFSTYKGKITPALIYIYGLGKEISSMFNKETNWESDLLNISTISKRQFKDYFVHPHWNHIKEAVMEIFDRALDYRIKNPTIFMDIACGGRIYENRKLNEAVEKIGCFAIRNSNDFIYKIPSRTHIAKESIDADWFISLHQFYNLLFTNDAIKKDRKGCKYIEKQCELMGWCHKNFVEKGEPDITRNSYNCKQSPWLNISPNEIKQCSFGRLWLAFCGNRIKLKCIN